MFIVKWQLQQQHSMTDAFQHGSARPAIQRGLAQPAHQRGSAQPAVQRGWWLGPAANSVARPSRAVA